MTKIKNDKTFCIVPFWSVPVAAIFRYRHNWWVKFDEIRARHCINERSFITLQNSNLVAMDTIHITVQMKCLNYYITLNTFKV